MDLNHEKNLIFLIIQIPLFNFAEKKFHIYNNNKNTLKAEYHHNFNPFFGVGGSGSKDQTNKDPRTLMW